MSDLKASLWITAKDSASGVFGRIAAGSKKMLSAFRRVDAESRKMLGGITRAQLAARLAGEGIGWGMRKAGQGALWAGKQVAGFALQITKWAAISAGAAVGFTIGGIIKWGMAMEEAAIELERIEGSADKAAAGIAQIKKLAWNSNVPLAELTAAFVEARKAGIDPMGVGFQNMMDQAVASKKPLSDVIEAVRDAKRGKFDGLGALGITVKASKGQAALTYLDKQGKRVTKIVRDTASAVERAVGNVFAAQSGGAAIQQAQTLRGLWGTIVNRFNVFQANVADKGWFKYLKQQMVDLLKWLDAKEKDGSLDRWARVIGENLKWAGEQARAFLDDPEKRRQFGEDLKQAGKSVWVIAKGLEYAAGQLSRLQGLSSVMGSGGPGGWLLGKGLSGIYDWVNPAAGAPTAAKGKPMVQGTGPLKPGAKPASVPNNMWMPRGPARPPMAPVKTSNALDIRIRTDPGTTASVTRTATSGGNMTVRQSANTGKVSFG